MAGPDEQRRPRVARRVDPLGFTEQVEFVGRPGQSLYAVSCRPGSRARAHAVLCPTVLADFVRGYPRDVNLARSLAAVGVEASRFHYLGTGNSDGAGDVTTFDQMVADACSVADRATDRATPTVFVGARLGAVVAAAAAARRDAGLLVLVEPACEARDYFREGLRTALAKRVREGGDTPKTSTDLVAELRDEGVIDLLGHALHLPLYESTVERTVVEELGARPRRILWVQFGLRGGLRSRSASSVEALVAAGHEVDVEFVGDQLQWWFTEERGAELQDTAPVVARWLLERCDEVTAR